MRRARTAALSVVALLVLGTAGVALEYASGAAFVARAAGAEGIVRRAADWKRQAVADTPVEIAWRDGRLRGRRYRAGPPHRPARAPPARGPRLGDRRAAAGRVRAGAGLDGPADRDGGAARPDPLQHHPAHHRHDRGCCLVAVRNSWPAGGRPDRHDGHQLRGRALARRGGTPVATPRVAFVLSFGGHGDLPGPCTTCAPGCSPTACAGRPTITGSRSSC